MPNLYPHLGSLEIGARAYFMFDTRDGTWAVAASISFKNENFELNLRAGTGSCSELGTYINGDLKAKLPGKSPSGTDNYLHGHALGVKHCGKYALAKNLVFEVRETGGG